MLGQVISIKLRRKAAIVAACVLILLGLVTAFRTNPMLHRFLGGDKCPYCSENSTYEK